MAPFVGALVSVPLFGEAVTVQLAAAGVLMAVGVRLHLSERHAHEHLHEALEHEHRHSHDAHHDPAEGHIHDDGVDPGQAHSHWHRHLPLRHSHAHTPDSHHRHSH